MNIDQLINGKINNFAEVLKVANKIVKSWEDDLIFVYLPEWSSFSNPNSNQNKYRHREKINLVIDNLQIEKIDMTDLFIKHNKPLNLFPLGINSHYNEECYELISKEILEKLTI